MWNTAPLGKKTMNSEEQEGVFYSIGISRLRIGNDGDGVTTLVAGYGCPLRCRYCLNPQCFLGKKNSTYSVKELIDKLKIDDLYFRATGGGIVFGGGEPLLQADFIKSFCESRPAQWIISLETSLAVDKAELEKVVEFPEYFLVDIKDMNPEIYKKYTGKSNENVIKNLYFLAEKNLQGKVCIRIPLIPGYNSEADRKYSMDMLKKMGYKRFNMFTYKTVETEIKRKKLEQEL